jgi:multisubunit Na+/H+ antiporter MnhG subunit
VGGVNLPRGFESHPLRFEARNTDRMQYDGRSGAAPATSTRAWLGPLVDASLYAAAAAFAAHSVHSSRLEDYRSWASIAWPAYAAAALAALILCFVARALGARRLFGVRAGVAALLLLLTVGAPLAAEMVWRAEGRSQYAPSEVVLTESAASALLHGRDPYSVAYGSPELAGRPPGIAKHFPYLPGMAVFGLPHALWSTTPWTDERMILLLTVGVVAALALAQWRAPPGTRLRALQVLLILPTGAPMVVTGSGDIAILALCLLALVLLHEGRQVAFVLTMAAAAALKLTAWPVVAALAVALPGFFGVRNVRLAVAFGCLFVGLVVFGGFAAGPTSFVDDVVLFPLGLTSPPSPAHTGTLGSLLVTSVADMSPLAPMRALLVGALLGAGVVVGAAQLFVIRRFRTLLAAPSSAAAIGSAGMLTALILCAPIGRSGYFLYPLDLAVWALLLVPRSPVSLVPRPRPGS